MQPQPLATHAHVNYGPLSTTVGRVSRSDGSSLVLLTVEGVNGSFKFLLDSDHARNLSSALSEMATGVVVAQVVPEAK